MVQRVANSKARLGKDLRRKVGNKKPRKVVEILCEGKLTEPTYLNTLKESLRHRDDITLNIKKGSGKDPRRIVMDAI